MEHREIKFSIALAELIRERRKSRRDICEALDITQSALSQYLHGAAYPTLQKLVDLAAFLETPLDYLILHERPEGKEVRPDATEPLASVLARSYESVQAQAMRHSQLVERIGVALKEEIDAKASAIAEQIIRENPSLRTLPNLWAETDLLLLEMHSQKTQILTFDLRFDVKPDPMKPGAFIPGPYFDVVKHNLAQGRSYQFLLVGTVEEWQTRIQALRGMLSGDIVRLCEFRCTSAPIIAACGFYQLDIVELQSKEVSLYERVSSGIDEEGWVGYTMTPAKDIEADLKIDREDVDRARKAFECLWNDAVDWRTL